MAWDPAQYRRFEDERNRPVRDLIHALGDRKPRMIVDAGCGPGNSTEALLRQFPEATILAFDSDPAMVDAARERLPHISVECTDIASWRPTEPVDLYFSNAVFHWLPDHLPLLAGIAGQLAPGGALAIQMPDNLGEPTHRLMESVAAREPWAGMLAPAPPARVPLPAPEAYVDSFTGSGLHVTVWRTTYFHRLPDAGGIVDFVAGAGLRPWLERLEARGGPDAARAYRAAYARAIAEAYPPLADGSVLMAMPRLFVMAQKPA